MDQCGRCETSVGGGGSGIRTHDTLSGTLLFKSSALNRSATPPPERGLSYPTPWREATGHWISGHLGLIAPVSIYGRSTSGTITEPSSC